MDKSTDKTYEWKHVVTIPHYLVAEIGDVGAEQTFDENYKLVDQDDLRVAITLQTGVQIVLIDCHQRLVIHGNGDIGIQSLVEK